MTIRMVHHAFIIAILVASLIHQSYSQGAYDPYTSFDGERRGSFSANQVVGIIFGSIAVVIALALTLGFCYYVYRKESQRSNGGQYTPTADQEL
ncbi:uncharacterized protein LOC107367633 [Tetranychus urticae]|uniref:Uncharacterized protein n=1 Tax=Tetranychus urticae TaxID=32264 RepID=T1KVQ1_TETUR|nr:uncharacterized protein LOC107367633 [Tetranychus urticae]